MKFVAIFIFLLSTTVSYGQLLEATAPSSFVPLKPYPFVLESITQGNVDLFNTQNLNIAVSGNPSAADVVKIKKGRGMNTLIPSATSSMSITASALNLNVPENTSLPSIHGGGIVGTEVWLAGSVHIITSHLQIGQADSLIIEPGCWVLIDSAVNITVDGHLEANGTPENPICFSSNSAGFYWGGIVINLGKGFFENSLFTSAGGDYSQAFGHSGSQAVLRSNGGELNANHCFILDCAGKGIGGQNGHLEFRNGAISRCDMGGEFGGSYVQVIGSHILDIPNDDGIFEDDDNDGLYVSGTSSETNEPSVIDSCVFMFGKDDGIDHNGAILEVRNSWIEGFENEGIAASNANSVSVYNSMFKDCEQGIEAGYGNPQVTVDHCVMIGNDNGLRFGDWYDWGCTGSITCTNSIMADNTDNIYNFDVLTAGPVTNAINLTYSLTNDSEYDNNTGCLAGTPSFNPEYLLVPGSPGVGLASDGLNMGLVGSIFIGINEQDNTIAGPLESIIVLDMNGRVVMVATSRSTFELEFRILQSGIYVVQENYGNLRKWRKQGVIR